MKVRTAEDIADSSFPRHSQSNGVICSLMRSMILGASQRRSGNASGKARTFMLFLYRRMFCVRNVFILVLATWYSIGNHFDSVIFSITFIAHIANGNEDLHWRNVFNISCESNLMAIIVCNETLMHTLSRRHQHTQTHTHTHKHTT